jgi:hypothetical protein
MASSRTAIANMALGKINQAAIQDFQNATDKVERVINTYFEDTYEEVCTEFPWNFCTDTKELAANQGTPVGFSNSFAIPNTPKTLRVLGIEEVGNTDPAWEKRGDELLINAATCTIKRLYKVEDITKVPSHIVNCIATLLASRIAIPILGVEGQSLMQLYQQMYVQDVRPNAIFIDANEGKNPVIEESTVLGGFMVDGRFFEGNSTLDVTYVDASGDFGTY